MSMTRQVLTISRNILDVFMLVVTFKFVFASISNLLVVILQNKDGSGDPSFPIIKDQAQFSVAHARYSKVVSFVHLVPCSTLHFAIGISENVACGSGFLRIS